jgi:hypothetical protein
MLTAPFPVHGHESLQPLGGLRTTNHWNIRQPDPLSRVAISRHASRRHGEL